MTERRRKRRFEPIDDGESGSNATQMQAQTSLVANLPQGKAPVIPPPPPPPPTSTIPLPVGMMPTTTLPVGMMPTTTLPVGMMPTTTLPVGMMPASSSVDNHRARLYVGSFYFDITEEELRKMFSPFGMIKKIDMSHDNATGQSKGYAFIWFADESSAEAALCLDGLLLGDRNMKVGRPTDTVIAGDTIKQEKKEMEKLAAFDQMSSSFIMVRNLNAALSVDILQRIFISYGSLNSITPSTNKLPYGFPNQPPLCYVYEGVQLEYSNKVDAFTMYTEMTNNGLNVGGIALTFTILNQAVILPLQTIQTTGEALVATTSKGSENELDFLPQGQASEATMVSLQNMLEMVDLKDPYIEDEIRQEAARMGDLKQIKIKVIMANGQVLTKEEFHKRNQGKGGNNDDAMDEVDEVGEYGPKKEQSPLRRTRTNSLGSAHEVMVYLTYSDIASAKKAWTTFSGRYFAGRQIIASIVAST
jgi:RNA recognition motif-containing protein